MALLGSFSLVCGSYDSFMDSRQKKIKSLANGFVGTFCGDIGAIALLLHAFGIRDEPSHELGFHEHKRGFLLFHQS